MYPCWAPAHVKGACSSILGVFSLKQHVLHLNMEFDQWEARAHHFKLILLSSRKKVSAFDYFDYYPGVLLCYRVMNAVV